jgi:hypothetical protein
MSAYQSRAHRAFSACVAMRLPFGLTVLAVLLPLTGCSVHPIPDDVSRKTTYDIVQEIRCEAKAAVEQYGRGIQEASIVYQFSFDINEHNDATGGFSLLYPGTSGTFNLGASADLNRERDGNRNFELIDSFDDLRKMNCKRDREVNWVYPLTGDVGMYDSVATFIRLQQADNAGGSKIFTFADTLTYTTTFTGGATSTLTLSPVTNEFRLAAANAGLSGSRMDMHKVVVTMATEKQTVVDKSGKQIARRMVPHVDAAIVRLGPGSQRAPGLGVDGTGYTALGPTGAFNSLLSTRMLQQESSAENRALYEQDRQRQLELQRRAADVRVLVGP